jgi:hypothetical protein
LENKYAHIFGKHIILEGIVLRPWHSKTLFCDHFLRPQDMIFFCPTTKYFLSQGDFDSPQDITPWLFDQELFSPNIDCCTFIVEHFESCKFWSHDKRKKLQDQTLTTNHKFSNFSNDKSFLSYGYILNTKDKFF